MKTHSHAPRHRVFVVSSALALMATVQLAGQTPAHAGVSCTDWAVAIGAPNETVSGHAQAGAVELRTSTGTATLLTAPSAQTNAHFGSALSRFDLDSNGCDDLLVGAPGAVVAAHSGAGEVLVFLNTPSGLTYDRTWARGQGSVPGPVQTGAAFGSSIVAVESNTTDVGRQSEVLIGAPGEDVGSAQGAGAVVGLYFMAAPVDPTDEIPPTTIRSAVVQTQNTAGIPGAAESGDRFGASVSTVFCSTGEDTDGRPFSGETHFMVGSPGEAIASATGAGAVVTYVATTLRFGDEGLNNGQVGDSGFFWSQNTAGMAGSAESGDHFGAAVSRGLIGAPDEDLASAKDAGMVNSMRCTHNEANLFVAGIALTQNTKAAGGAQVSGAAEAGDRFGAALSGDLIGVPGEDVGSVVDAGMINRYQSGVGTTQNSVGVTDVAETKDLFGAAVLDSATDMVGTPGEDGAGSVIVLPGSSVSVSYRQSTRHSGDRYGAVLS